MSLAIVAKVLVFYNHDCLIVHEMQNIAVKSISTEFAIAVTIITY